MVAPLQKLHFVEHPRYGQVYPFVTLNHDKNYPKTAMASTIGLTILNTSILYSTLIMPIYTAQATAFFLNPLFLVPSLLSNYLIWRKSNCYFYGDRA